MFEDYITQNNEIELNYFTKSHNLFSNRKFSKSKCSTTGLIMLDKQTNQYVPFQIKCNSWDCEECSSQKAEILKSKLNIIAPQEDLSFFLTLTTKPIDLSFNDQITKNLTIKSSLSKEVVQNMYQTLELSTLFKKFKQLSTEYDKSFDINKIKSRYKYKTLKQAENKRRENLKKYFDYEVEVQIKKIVRKHSILKIANKKRIYLKKLTDKEVSEFISYNKKLIAEEYEKQYEKKRNKLLKDENFMKAKREWFDEVINRNQDKEKSYFLVVEATKNKHPHFHILLNRFIPSYLIENILGLDSRIYKNFDLKEKISENDEIFYRKSTNYVLKYFFKSMEGEHSTHTFLKNLNKIFRLYYFSSNLYKRYPFLKNKQKSANDRRFKKIDYFVGKLNSNTLTFNPQDYDSKLSLDINYQKFKANLTKNKINKTYLRVNEFFRNEIEEYEALISNSSFYQKLKLNVEAGKLVDFKKISPTNELFFSLSSPFWEREKNVSGLDMTQIQVLQSLFSNKITICTGDGGSGKTTILKELNDKFGDKCEITYCSLTAQSCININNKLNLSEKKKARTIHKTFNNIFSRHSIKFRHNENNILDTDILVIDEFTMVDKEIFYNILKALPPKTHILLLGDNKQLSNFKSNSLYYELSNIEKISFIKLKGQYRSNDKVLLKIKDFLDKKEIDCKYSEEILKPIISKILLNKNLKILCNTNELVKKINLLCFELDSKNRDIKTLSLYDFKIGDIIMNIKNNPFLDDLSNGENLTVLSYDKTNKVLLVQRHINNQILEVPLKDTFYLIPAYAMTIHKSQGSEFDKGFIFIENTKGLQLCNRNIIYTACSRFRKDFELYFLDEKSKNKSYKNSANESNVDIFQFQKYKELLSCLSYELVSNPNLKSNDLSQVFTN